MTIKTDAMVSDSPCQALGNRYDRGTSPILERTTDTHAAKTLSSPYPFPTALRNGSVRRRGGPTHRPRTGNPTPHRTWLVAARRTAPTCHGTATRQPQRRCLDPSLSKAIKMPLLEPWRLAMRICWYCRCAAWLASSVTSPRRSSCAAINAI